MEKIKTFFIPTHALVIIALTAIAVTSAFLFSFNPLLPLFAGSSLLVLSLFFQGPLLLLSALIIVRMSVDYSSQFITLSLFERTFTLSQLIGLGIALLGTLLILQKRDQFIRYPLVWPLLLVIIWGLATASYSVAIQSTLTEVIRVFGLLSIGLMAYVFTNNKKDYQALLIAILLSSILPLVMSLYQTLFGVGFTDSDVAVPRIFGTFSHPNILSLYLFTLLAVVTLFYIAPIFTNATQKRNVTLILMAVVGFFLLLTFTRVAWVAAFLFFSIIIFFRYKIALIPILLFPIVLYFVSGTFSDRVNESLSPDPDSSIVWRQNLWHDTMLKTVQDDRTTFGYGMSTFPLVSETLRGENVGSHDPHNDFVRFFVEGGYVGITVYILYTFSILLILFRQALKQKGWLRDSLLILTLLWFCLLLASLSDNIFKNTPVEWIFFILAGALLKLSSQK
jgi:hypothetical protein